MSAFQVLAIISGVGCIYMYLKNKNDTRLEIREQVARREQKFKELESYSEELRNGIEKKKAEYENKKLVFLRSYGEQPTGTSKDNLPKSDGKPSGSGDDTNNK